MPPKLLALAALTALLLGACTGEPPSPAPVGPSPQEAPEDKPTLRVAIPGGQTTSQQTQQLERFSAHLGQALGASIELLEVPDHAAAGEALASKAADFAWLDSVTFVQVRSRVGARPLVTRAVDLDLHSGFIVHSESGVTAPADLKGKTFAFGAKGSLSGHLMPYHFLSTFWELDPNHDFDGAPTFTGGDEDTVRLVQSGSAHAGVIDLKVWEQLANRDGIDPTKVQLAWATPKFAGYVWAGRKSLAPQLLDKFTEALTALSAADPAQRIILTLQRADKYVVASDVLFDPIEGVARATGLLH